LSQKLDVQENESSVRIPISGTWAIEGPSISYGLERLDIGFTGTRKGMSDVQKLFVGLLLDRISDINPHTQLWGHHGDCIGADDLFDTLAIQAGFSIHLHPPTETKWRAWRTGTAEIVDEELPYRKRNQAIVDAASLLIATPHRAEDDSRSTRSGTWMTIRMARRADKPHVIIYPNGIIEGREWWRFLK
jgi:hypothetical protein